MAEVIRRAWKSGPRKVKRVAYGYTVQVNGKQVRKFDSAWTEDDAQKALAAAVLGRDVPKPAPAAPAMLFGRLFDEYITYKTSKGKRSLDDDQERGRRLLDVLGTETPVREITTRRVAEYATARLTTKSRLGRTLAPATVNRELSLLRCMLRLARRWEYIDRVPDFELSREYHRLRYFSEAEIARLLEACRRSRNPHLFAIVVVALHTGMRKGEVLGLAWERVDFARNVLILERTKSGKGRDLPINQAVYDVLAPPRAQALAALPTGEELRGPAWRKADGTSWDSIRTAYERALREAKIIDATFHTLRHTFASWFVIRGGNLAKLQVLLGHATITMTMKYAHLAPDHLQGATAILEGLGQPRSVSTTSAQSLSLADVEASASGLTTR